MVVSLSMNFKVKSLLFLFFFLIVKAQCYCQDSSINDSLVHQMLSRIFYIQEHHEKDFPAGLIPSYRQYHHKKDVFKNDDNIFFTGLVVFTLQYLYPSLDKHSQTICDTIFSHAAPLYARHRNRKGRSTYNFWQTDKPEIFPDGGWLNLFNKRQALPDDMDVTAIVLLADDAADSTIRQVHLLMQDYTGRQSKKARSTLPAYKNSRAYSTWFGKKMPIDFDFCVMTNILYLVNKNQLSYTSADSASLDFIVKVIENRDHINHASVVSPSYNRTPIILYHISRLMAQTKMPNLEKYRAQLVKDAISIYNRTNNFFDKILLSTSLMRWGIMPPNDSLIIVTTLEDFVEKNNFVFFIANMASVLSRPYNVLIGNTGIGKFNYYSPAYDYTLLIENIIVRKTMKQRNNK